MSKCNIKAKKKIQRWLDDAIICHKRLRSGPYGSADLSIFREHSIHLSYQSFKKICKIMGFSDISYKSRYTEDEILNNPELANTLYEVSVQYKGWKLFCLMRKDVYDKIQGV